MKILGGMQNKSLTSNYEDIKRHLPTGKIKQ